MGTRQLSLFLVGAQVKTAPLTMHLLLALMVGTCAAMSVRKSPYVYQSNPLPPTQGDKAGPTGATRLDLSANSDGGLQGGDPHQAGNRRLRPHRGHLGEPEADSPRPPHWQEGEE